MNLTEIEKIKVGLMCRGMKLSEKFKNHFTRYRFKRASLSEGVCVIITKNGEKAYINTGVFERYVENSPYHYNEMEKKIYSNGIPLCDAEIFMDPEWYKFKLPDGREFQSIVQEHAPGVLATSITSRCSFKEKGVGCAFCALSGSTERSPEDIRSVLSFLREKGYKHRELNINSGTITSEEDFGVKKYGEIAEAGKEFGLKIYIQIPPVKRESLLYLKSMGVDSISFNLEIYNDEIRKKLCPGKSSIEKEKYFKAIEEGVKVFGEGQVSSWLIIGLEPVEDTIKGIDAILARGGLPYPTVFRPLRGTPLENLSPPSVETVEKVFTYLKEKLLIYKLSPALSKAGCVNCGCCTVM